MHVMDISVSNTFQTHFNDTSMTSKLYKDPEFGDITLRKNSRSRGISIRVRGVAGRNGTRVSVTVPFSLRYQDGIEYLEKRREWVRDALARQKKKSEDAAQEGKSIYNIEDGTVVRTLLSEIVFRAIENTEPQEFGKRKLTIKSARVENPQETGRLWLSPEHPLSIKVLNYPKPPSIKNTDSGIPFKESLDIALGNTLRATLIQVLREEAKLLLPQKAYFFAEQYGFKFNDITIKHNSSNWGSCSRMGNINLNLNLIRLPEPLCDYVILHELCHLREPNHGPRFHALLEHLCLANIKHLLNIGSPDAQKYAKWVESYEQRQSEPRMSLRNMMRRLSADRRVHTSPLPPLDEVLSREISRWRLI